MSIYCQVKIYAAVNKEKMTFKSQCVILKTNIIENCSIRGCVCLICITYTQLLIAISLVWVAVRAVCSIKNRKFNIKREAQLLLVYVCIVVVARFTFFPFSKVDGVIQPLVLDFDKIIPLRLNFVPFVNAFDYPTKKEIVLNLVGNTAMFIPLGIVWPVVFKKLDTHLKVIGAGAGFSLIIEILQLPFFDRVSDVDDLILNSVGFIIGYGIYLFAKGIKSKVKNRSRV